MPNLAQRTFSRGEIDPKLNSRVDLAAYFASLSQCRNAFVPRSGGIVSRPGTEWVGEVKDSTKTVRLIPFVFSADDAYALEFGENYMRVIRDGAYVTESSYNIASISTATSAIVTITAHPYSTGDEIYISGVVGMTEVNNLVYVVATTATNSFYIEYKQSLTHVDTTGFTAYSSGGTAARLYKLTTTYTETEVAELNYCQAQDTIILTHTSHPPSKLVRSGHASWALSEIKNHRYEAPRAASGTVGTAGSRTTNYRISCIFDADGTESLPCTGTSSNIATASATNPVQITVTAHGYSAGDEIRIAGIGGMTELNERQFVIATAATNTFTLLNTDGTSYTAYTSGGVVARVGIRLTSAAIPTITAPNVLSWSVPQLLTATSATAAASYLVYRESGGIYSLIGQTTDTTFNDTNLAANAAYSPLYYNEVFFGSGNYPGVCIFYQQRLILGSTTNQPRTFWGSVIGDIYNFTTHFPLEEDDPFEFTIADNEVTAIRGFADLRRLLLLTDASEAAANGDGSGALTVSQPNVRQYSHNGSGTLRPIIANTTALYVQKQGSLVRDLGFDFGEDGYKGVDLTAWSAHLLDGFTIVDWTYKKLPDSTVWAVRSDGKLLSLTYVKEQQISGWAKHDTDGTYENVCAIPEGTETALYVVVNRTINGGTHRYVERMASRAITDPTDIRDYIGMDCAAVYDGRNTTSANTMTLTGTTYTTTSTINCTSSSSLFTAAYVGKYVFLHGSSGELVRLLITAYTSPTVVTGTPDIDVPASMQAVALSEWGIGTTTVRGLWHLEQERITAFGDGWTRANPNSSSYSLVTVSSGIATLSSAHEIIAFGMPFVTDLQTLDIDNAQGQSIMDQSKLVSHVTVYMNNSREFWSGEALPDDDSQTGLKPSIAQRPSGTYLDAPPELFSEPKTLAIQSRWNKGGRVCIRGLDPYPLEIISVCPHFTLGK